MHTIGFDGRKLLEAICFEGAEKTIEPQPITLGEFDKKNSTKLVDLMAIINNIVRDMKEDGDNSVPIEGYDLCRALVGSKNAFYLGAIVDSDEYGYKTLQLAAKGNEHSINKFKKEIENYDKCVSCNAITTYKKSTPIQERENYVEGAGQLCNSCDTKIYGEK